MNKKRGKTPLEKVFQRFHKTKSLLLFIVDIQVCKITSVRSKNFSLKLFFSAV